MDKVALDLVTDEGKVFDVNVACPGGGFLCIGHGGAAVVVFIGNRGGFLWYIEVPEDAAEEQGHAAYVTGGHEFCLCGGEGDSGLELFFVGDCASCKLDANPAEGSSCVDAGSPVGVGVRHCNGRVVYGTIVEEEVLHVAVDGW